MIVRLTLCLTLAACSAAPVVSWPAGPVPATPALLPADGLVAGPVASAEARGAALAAQAAALRARAAGIGTP
jgi:hypothetical protein